MGGSQEPQAAASQKTQQALRAERDRFVALAFCWADLLLELTPDRTIAFAAGATTAILGYSIEELQGRDLTELTPTEDRATMRQLMGDGSQEQGRIDHAAIRLMGSKGPTPPLTMTGYRLEDLNNHYFMAFRIEPVRPRSMPEPLQRDSQSGLLEATAFTGMAEECLELARVRGDECQLTLLNLDDFTGFRSRLEAETERELAASIGAALRVNSLYGDSAARLGDDRYGLLHKPALDVASLKKEIEGFARHADPQGKGLAVSGATLEMDSKGLADENMSRALAYTINQFHEQKGKDFTIHSLSSSLSTLADETVRSVRAFKQVIDTSDFDIAFQPIVRIGAGEIGHFEALARFRNSEDESPYKTITFAEEIGLICDFDMAMVQRVIDWLVGPGRHLSAVKVAVNISGYSLNTLSFVAALHGKLKHYPNLHERLLFEITETVRITDFETTNRFIQSLRSAGHKVCLDDFGAGAANFQYLSALEVDTVKIDGAAVQGSRTAPKGRPFLKALANLCRDLRIATIAEMVNDERTLEFVHSCDIGYAQGYLYGKPSKDIREFAKLKLKPMKPLGPRL